MEKLSDWYPYKLDLKAAEPLVQWINLKDINFVHPFFNETISTAQSKLINSSRFKNVSSIDVLPEWATNFTTVRPSAFIFHISRCGSTLLSQLLGMEKAFISLSEVPFFDDILRLPYKMPQYAPVIDSLFQAALALYGRRRTSYERHLFVKTDSWHIFFWRQIRALYPKVPFILLYRNPGEVLRSNQKQRGMQAVPGLIEPEVMGFSSTGSNFNCQDEYFSNVLANYFKTYTSIMQSDNKSLLLNYSDGPFQMLEKVLNWCNIELTDATRNNVLERTKYHSKYPDKAFFPEPEQEPIPELKNSFDFYNQLEQARLNQMRINTTFIIN